MIITHNGNIIMSDGFILNKVSSTPTPPSFADTKSFQFDGVTDRFIGVGNYSELDGQNKATFSFWIKPPSVISSIQVVSSVRINTSASNKQFQIQLYTSGLIALEQDSGSKYIRGNSSALNLGQWNHVLFCFDTTQGSSANRGRVFINGINETLATSVSGVFSTATGGLYIAENQNGQYDPFEGLLNEFSIWSGSDQRANVSEIWNGGLPNDLNTLPTAPQPTTWFRMGENAVWDGSKFVMTDVNGGYVNTSVGILPTDPNPTTDVPLFDNKSFTYDGVSDRLEINRTLGNGFSELSISTWVKYNNNLATSNQYHPIVAKIGPTFGDSFVLQNMRSGASSNGGELYFGVTTNNGTFNVFSGVVPSQNVWYNVMGTYDGSNIKIYIDGVLEGTLSATGNILTTNTLIYLGDSGYGGFSQFFNGSINDVSIFDTDQSANALTIFNGGLPNNISALSPISYWRAEQVTFDGTDWTLIDQGSGGNNGTSVSMPLTARTSDVPLFDNKSFTYDGIADYVNVADNNNLSFGDGSTDSPFSILFWVKIEPTTQSSNVFIGKSNFAPNREYAIGMFGGSRKIRFFIKNQGGNSQQSIDSTTTISNDTWYHIAVTYDGSGGNNAADGMTIYINGNSETPTNVLKNSYTAMNNTSADFTIGKYNTASSNIAGNINDTSIFNSELTQAQVTEIYNGGIANDISNLNPISYWRSEFANWDGSNWTMIDQGSGANNGLTSSMPLTSRTSDVPT